MAIPAFGQTSGPAPASAQREGPERPYKFSGLVFGDYYAFPTHHLDTWKGQHGLWLRRVYFTYDHAFTPSLTSRLRLEMNSNGRLEGGALTPYVKDAWLRWTFMERQALTVGLQPTLTFDFIEQVWALRHIEKTPLDLYRWDSSRDTALAVAGPITGNLRYAAQFGNESGSGGERDRHKAYRVSARYETSPGFSVEAMYGHFDRARDADRLTAQVFGAWRGARGRAGVQYSFQRRRAPDGSQQRAHDMRLVSGFAVFDVQPKQSSVFLRVDRHADPCSDCAAVEYLPLDPSRPFTMTLAGIDHAVHPSIRLSPNLEWVSYDDPARTSRGAKADLVLRLTFYWVF
jgi:hypothetical protein